ncbi:phospholipid carrier-dependent glycosyltransferase [Kitasatospora viridis]|uniref:4-amino-4-deoxy-L-arabinose transferase-like glycosyltransferase n=1 Tax=Kitasatospora viridis TaxID=281105 RepID=A0A561T6H7_9ACTN|nr:phospholipid carrier-dependent glycosyltransferase [Kitasatospora viridis]TWF82714.1 4-amino-4-deoxy-L-arabinose transferase-like glycosyltransferase [Kitasatospora viridis]
MTLTLRPTVATAAARLPVPARQRNLTALVAAVAFLVTAGLRLIRIGSSGDLFIDELIYRQVGHSAAQGGFPQSGGAPFFLHPPAFFYLEAGWEKLFGYSSDTVTAVYGMRPLNALFAAGTAALIVVLVMRVTRSPLAASVGAALFALDPYAIRQNDRVMLETSLMFWVLAGLLVLLPLIDLPNPRRARGRAVCAGLLFGVALLTKDEAVLLTLLPLALAVLLRLAPRRRLLLLTGAVAIAPYACYVALIAVTGHFGQFWTAKTSGISRLAGLTQSTGFNAQGAPSLTGRLAAEATTYGSSYLLLAAGPVALLLLLHRGSRVHRMLSVFYGCSALALGYALAIGTLEEQALYLLLVPTTLLVAVALPVLRGDAASHPLRRVARVCGAGLLAVALTGSAAAYTYNRVTPDDGYARLLTYLEANVPAGSPISAPDGGATAGVTSWALQGRYPVGDWLTLQQRQQAGAQYLVVPWQVIDQGYGAAAPADVHALAAQGTLLFSFHGRTYGQLALYRIPLPPTPAAGTAPGASHG